MIPGLIIVILLGLLLLYLFAPSLEGVGRFFRGALVGACIVWIVWLMYEATRFFMEH